jgi:hypothetical protein
VRSYISLDRATVKIPAAPLSISQSVSESTCVQSIDRSGLNGVSITGHAPSGSVRADVVI